MLLRGTRVTVLPGLWGEAAAGTVFTVSSLWISLAAGGSGALPASDGGGGCSGPRLGRVPRPIVRDLPPRMPLLREGALPAQTARFDVPRLLFRV